MVFTSKVKVVISAIAIVLSSILISIDMFGVIPFLVLVVSLFTLIIQGGLCWLGYKNGDAFDAYQDLERTEATALTNLFKDKKECEKR
ncbi:hypothetical protein DC364_19835 [Vibrio vulnificus]|uniref:hypothetical protein n=1 Tax=Vibrio vulnificus TaxID=672 RepID=UPI000D3EB4B5|nr:hypothetical protein [Vibrio vulnificus]PUZ92070.1 hypothetical protein DC364_19835 [Vibrio vulnificus]BDP32354.1 hypothetical protein VV208B2_34340 [Vibrio vulnificus]HBH7893173.1 hypothetical protein [Vibrio vulnificus]